MSDTLSVLTTSGPLLAKQWLADGGISAYDDAKYYTLATRTVGSIGELSALLQALERKPRSCLIRGRFVGLDLAAIRDSAEFKPGKVRRSLEYFEDQPLHTLLVDVDEFTPTTCDALDAPLQAIEEFIATRLPPEFSGASYHWQLSNSAGHPSKGRGLRAHLWFWSSRALTCAQLTTWAKRTAFAGDIALFRTVQVHYTAAPVLAEGVVDPFPVRSGFVDGIAGDEVDLDLDAVALAATGVETSRGERLAAVASDDPIATALYDQGLVRSQARDGALNIACPFSDEHSTGEGAETSTQYYPPFTGGYAVGHFKCLHATCAERPRGAFLERLGLPQDDEVTAEDFPDETVNEDGTPKADATPDPVALDWSALPEEPPEPRFVIPGWLPENTVTLLAAHGGTGKSFMSLYIGLCLATGRHPFESGAELPRARVVLYSAEDDMTVMQWRLRRYMALLGVGAADLQGWLLVLDATGSDNVLFARDRHGLGKTTKRFAWLRQQCQAFSADVLVFDNASDGFDGNEVERAAVRQFIGSLKRVAPTTLLLSHVDAATSMAAPGEGKGYSGSTAWNNSVRSRWLMARRENEDIVLSLQKSNYARTGSEAAIRWADDRKLFEVISHRIGVAKANDHRPLLLGLLRKLTVEMGKDVSPAKTAQTSAFNLMKDMPGFPHGLKTGDVAREVMAWVHEGLAREETYSRGNRHEGVRLVLTALGESVIFNAQGEDDDSF